MHLENREDLCSTRNVDIEYKCSQGEDLPYIVILEDSCPPRSPKLRCCCGLLNLVPDESYI